jgi:homoserine O-acetyltransferase
MKRESAGLVETQSFRIPEEIALEHGGQLSDVDVAYETYGKLNSEKNNAISALPVVDDGQLVIGMVTSDGVSRLISVCR